MEYFPILLKLITIVVLSGLIGFEREKHKDILGLAGLRTHMLVGLGATLTTIVSVYGFNADPARVAAGIITSIGFIGAGTIIATKGGVRGLTTATSIWVVSAIGIAVAVSMYVLSIFTTALVLIILEFWRFEKRKFYKNKKNLKIKGGLKT